MKKNIITIILMILFHITSQAACFNLYINGYWGEWVHYSVVKMKGTIDDFVLYSYTNHPSNYFVRVTINNYQEPTVKDQKSHYKSNTWYEYSGTVEYYVTDEEPTIKDILTNNITWIHWMFINPHDVKGTSCVKRTAKATIKAIPNYRGATINVFFDGVGFGISPDCRYYGL